MAWQMNLTEATKSCFANYAKFSGRSDRYEFWNFVLFLLLANIALLVVNSVVFGPTITHSFGITIDGSGQQTSTTSSNTLYDGGWLSDIFTVVTLLPWLAVTWRRMLDTGRPGWYSLLPIALAAISFGLIFVTSSPMAIDSSMVPEGVSMPVSISVPRWPLLLLPVWLACVGSVILVIVWLARASDPDSNRFGAMPSEVNKY